MLVCADGGGNGQQDNKSRKGQQRGRGGRKSKGWRVVLVVSRGGLPVQMVGGVETKMCVPAGDVTPSINKGCSPFWLTG